MTVRQRRLVAVLAGLALGLSRVFPATALPALWECPFQRLLHLPCPGCGLTRACCAISHGDFAAAWALNPFGYVFYAGALLALAWPLLVAWRPRWAQCLCDSRAMTASALALALGLCGFGLARILWLAVRSAGG